MYEISKESQEMIDFSLAPILLRHEAKVLIFKVKPNNFFECASKYIPNVILTLTEDFKFHLWIENFASVRSDYDIGLNRAL